MPTFPSDDDAAVAEASEWQEDTREHHSRGSQKSPTMYIASKNIKTAFGVARPKHGAKVLENRTPMGG